VASTQRRLSTRKTVYTIFVAEKGEDDREVFTLSARLGEKTPRLSKKVNRKTVERKTQGEEKGGIVRLIKKGRQSKVFNVKTQVGEKNISLKNVEDMWIDTKSIGIENKHISGREGDEKIWIPARFQGGVGDAGGSKGGF